ncbi:hypothetical protein [Bacteroides sp. 519]|uniref:hypothetical protein n=1 Tax=Bacteroides sp. 519 TaxID=2302937 RepID=UPI0013D83320|nr:hypothetical protein [Bacteroides sp. 519]NDV58942.1 hypothetical protein [Bacteroides sp. 519]
MNYIELINAFWEHDEAHQFTGTETRLYFYLLKITNRLGWLQSWSRNDNRLTTELGVTPKTLRTARQSLADAGLISYATEKGRNSKTTYEVLAPKHFIKQGKKDLINYPENSLYIRTRDKPKQKQKQKLCNNSSELLPHTPPDINDIKLYFTNKTHNWEREAELFYYHFDGVGWETTTGTAIKNWKSKANYWITKKNMKDEQQRNTTNIQYGSANRNTPATQQAGSIRALEDLANAILGEA